MVAFPRLGRQPHLPQGMPIEGAAGNGRVTAAPASTSWGGLRYAAPNQESGSVVQPGSGHNRLQARDRHAYLDAGSSMHSGLPSNSGIPNPTADGPARPALDVVNRNLTWQVGTDATTMLDNSGPFAVTQAHAGMAADGRTRVGPRPYPLGTQGDTYSRVYGGTPGLYRPYGARGVVYGPPIGSPLDGPQTIRGGVPHGRHSPTIPGYKLTRQNYRVHPQQVAPWANRPANSRIAGQSYSQTVVHLGGTTPNPMPTIPGIGQVRQPGMNRRFTR